MSYDTTTTISYTDDDEYRAVFNHQFGVDSEDFDDLAVKKVMDDIYGLTKDHVLFGELYRKGAAMFLSEDVEVGLMVMFSYDFFAMFHRVFCAFMKEEMLSADNPYYVLLLEKL